MLEDYGQGIAFGSFTLTVRKHYTASTPLLFLRAVSPIYLQQSHSVSVVTNNSLKLTYQLPYLELNEYSMFISIVIEVAGIS